MCIDVFQAVVQYARVHWSNIGCWNSDTKTIFVTHIISNYFYTQFTTIIPLLLTSIYICCVIDYRLGNWACFLNHKSRTPSHINTYSHTQIFILISAIIKACTLITVRVITFWSKIKVSLLVFGIFTDLLEVDYCYGLSIQYQRIRRNYQYIVSCLIGIVYFG